MQPDNSENAQHAFENGQLEPDVYVEAMGFDPADRPKINPEMRETILIRSAMTGTPLSDGYFLLFPEDKPSPEDQAMEANAAKGIDPAQAEALAKNDVGPSAGASASAANVKKAPPAKTGAPK